ncbi:cytochrome oxidase assembly protein [Planctomonas sp. JC2975]|nr:COX15/CtaA family protein [Planctomonas sp. JC2975]NNC10503.1 cytochrome oxidase assembly protein [Planctomonas sp. JC2975]
MKTPLGWLADRWTLSPRSLRWATTASLVVSILIVLGGGIVRVTGSGLGCPTWPTCDASSITPTPAMGIHALIEFSNRMLTVLLCVAVAWVIIAARLQRPRVRSITRLAWSQFWLVVVNAVAGGISVWTGLNPYVVAFHFVMAMGLLTTTTLTWHRVHEKPVTADARARITAAARALSWALAALTAVLIVVGTLVSGSGPHSGDSADVPRMGFDWIDITIVHGVLGASTLVVAVVLAMLLWRSHATLPLVRTLGFLVIVALQGVVGLIQALTALPALLVAVHLVLAAMVWVGALRVLLDVNPQLFPSVHTAEPDTASVGAAGAPLERAS